MITWLEDPLKYAYLRKTTYWGNWSKYPEKNLKLKLGGFDRLVGYELSRHPEPYLFIHTVYWLKTGDRGASKPHPAYAGPATFGGHMPCEAVDPRELVKYGCTEQITESEK